MPRGILCGRGYLRENCRVKLPHASVYKRKGSPRWTIAYWSPQRKKRVFVTTPYRISDSDGLHRAFAKALDFSVRAQADRRNLGNDRWERWVPEFLDLRYANSPASLRRMRLAWRHWHSFMADRAIVAPRQVTYQVVLDFVAWRTQQPNRSGGLVSRNTALREIHLMSLLLNESIRRGFVCSNPCQQLEIPPLPVARKPEITDDEIARIRAALVGRPEWMRICFEIALHQGCRLSETRIPLDQVDLDRRTITFAAKGRRLGGRHVFVARLHGALVPLMLQLKAEGRAVTCELPSGASSCWHHLFRQIGLSHLCFHCTRVTTITRLARARVPIAEAMAYVGHVSRTVHRIYQRLVPADLAGVESALSFGLEAWSSSPSSKPNPL